MATLLPWQPIKRLIRQTPTVKIITTMENIPNQAGHLILSDDGIILSSGGQLENDEKLADTIFKMLKIAQKKDLGLQDDSEGFYKFSVNYSDHSYVICLSNRKIHIIKRLEGGMTIAV